jgi:hypothetical protein
MPQICFIYTDTNGLHKSNDFVCTKKLYKYARLIAIHYIIGEYNSTFTQIMNKSIILKPKTINFDQTAMKFHKITYEDAINKGIDNVKAIQELKNDLKNVNIIVGHSLPFHIKAIQVECFRTAIDINFNKFINIDMMSFAHKLDYPKLKDLVIKYNINKELNQIEQYRDLFFVLYKEYSSNKTSKTLTKTSNNTDIEFVD